MIQGLWRHPLRLWKPKVCPEKQQDVKCGRWKCCFALQVPFLGVEHVRRYDRIYNSQEVVRVTPKGYCLVAELHSAYFGGNSVWNGTNSDTWCCGERCYGES